MTLTLENIAKDVGAETHLYETNLTLKAGEFTILLGATGAGKTTLVKLMAGLERPTAGRITLNGRDLTRISPQKRNVSLVHQFFVNYPNMTVAQNIASPLKVARMAEAEIARRVEEAAALLRLTPYMDRKPAELSGGQQQRTALARAIVKDSDLVLLDEPLANLDYKLREELRDQLPKLFADRGSVVVYTTSEPLEALLLGGTTVCLSEGRVAQAGPTTEVYQRPADLLAAQVFSDPPMNAVPVTKFGGEIKMGPTSFATPISLANAPDGPYTMGVRPHFVSPLKHQDGISVNGIVEITELSGSESTAHFKLEGRSWVSQSPGIHSYRVGEKHEFSIDIGGCFFFDPQGNCILPDTEPAI